MTDVAYDPTPDLNELCLLVDHEAPTWLVDQCDATLSGSNCWPWTGPRLRRHGDGKGDRAVAVRGGKTTTAARHLWTEMRGPLPRSLVVRHVCDQPLCVRPSHLMIGTPKANSMDARRRGRLRPGGQPLNRFGVTSGVS